MGSKYCSSHCLRLVFSVWKMCIRDRYINGSDTPLDEPYLPEPMEGSYGPYEVPEGCYFMMGDNRNNSLDARFWDNKFVAKNKIVAKVLFCYYPFNRIGKVD